MLCLGLWVSLVRAFLSEFWDERRNNRARVVNKRLGWNRSRSPLAKIGKTLADLSLNFLRVFALFPCRMFNHVHQTGQQMLTDDVHLHNRIWRTTPTVQSLGLHASFCNNCIVSVAAVWFLVVGRTCAYALARFHSNEEDIAVTISRPFARKSVILRSPVIRAGVVRPIRPDLGLPAHRPSVLIWFFRGFFELFRRIEVAAAKLGRVQLVAGLMPCCCQLVKNGLVADGLSVHFRVEIITFPRLLSKKRANSTVIPRLLASDTFLHYGQW